jgi:hypothetical protein
MKENLEGFQHFNYKHAQWEPKPSFEEASCWGPSSSEGPQKHDLTMFLEYNT